MATARQYGEIIDIHFPNVEPSFISSKINCLTDITVNTITELGKDITVHIMGMMTFTFVVVTRLKALGILSTTGRNTIIAPDGNKISDFKFVQFRKY